MRTITGYASHPHPSRSALLLRNIARIDPRDSFCPPSLLLKSPHASQLSFLSLVIAQLVQKSWKDDIIFLVSWCSLLNKLTFFQLWVGGHLNRTWKHSPKSVVYSLPQTSGHFLFLQFSDYQIVRLSEVFLESCFYHPFRVLIPIAWSLIINSQIIFHNVLKWVYLVLIKTRPLLLSSYFKCTLYAKHTTRHLGFHPYPGGFIGLSGRQTQNTRDPKVTYILGIHIRNTNEFSIWTWDTFVKTANISLSQVSHWSCLKLLTCTELLQFMN